MKFTLTHARAVIGNDIKVSVEADDGKEIRRVLTILDGFQIADDQLVQTSDSYERTFLGVGNAGPNVDHTLVVSAEQDDSKTHSSTSIWTDSI